jgi:hypothetical protein
MDGISASRRFISPCLELISTAYANRAAVADSIAGVDFSSRPG